MLQKPRKKIAITWEEVRNRPVYIGKNHIARGITTTQRKCRVCGTAFSVKEYNTEVYVTKNCNCGADGKKILSIEKLEPFMEQKAADQVIKQINNDRKKGLPNTLGYWISRGYSESDARKQQSLVQKERSKKSPATLKGVKEFSVRCKEYWIKKGYSEIDAKLEVAKQQVTNGLDFYIKRYGLDLGQKKFNQRIQQWLSSDGCRKMVAGRSSKSLLLFDQLAVSCNAYYGHNEKVVRGKIKSHRVDFLCGKNIIEYFGDYWHANPLIYLETDSIRKKTASQIWAHDCAKINDLIAAGYNICIVWETEWVLNPDQTFKRCDKFLNDN